MCNIDNSKYETNTVVLDRILQLVRGGLGVIDLLKGATRRLIRLDVTYRRFKRNHTHKGIVKLGRLCADYGFVGRKNSDRDDKSVSLPACSRRHKVML